MTFRYAAIVIALLLSSLSACRQRDTSPAQTPQPNAALQMRVGEARLCPGAGEAAREASRAAQRFYKQNSYALIWSEGAKPRPIVADLVASLRGANQDGLEPAAYRVEELEALARDPIDEARAVDLDVQASCRFLTFGWQLAHGLVDPKAMDSQWKRAPRKVDPAAALQSAAANGQVAASLQRLAPASPQYGGLKHQLARYRALPREPAGDAKIELIVLNMERWRWMPDDLGSRYVMVNIPRFRLDLIEEGRSVLDMKVVVGKTTSRTPVFADQMTSIVFSPYWNIPPDIARNETVALARKDPGYLERNNIEIVGGTDAVVDAEDIDWDNVDAGSLRFRQLPGPGNSLGLVKFIFPNHFNVYLHDTPSKSFFAKIERDFSHGCVRIERPKDLARAVLRDQPEWTDDKIESAMRAGTERTVPLKQPLPVYLTYFTAWEDNGDIHLGNDVYGYDAKQRTNGL